MASASNMEVSLYTSGCVQNFATIAARLQKQGARKFIFSLFGASQSPHERITRVLGSFSLTLESVKAAKRAGLQTELHFVPTGFNYKELEAVVRLGRTLAVSCVSVLRFVPQGRGYLLKRRILTRLQNLEIKSTIERLRKEGFQVRTGSPYNFLFLNSQPQCAAGIDRMIVLPDASVSPCDAFKQIRANDLVGKDECSALDRVSLEVCWAESKYLQAVRTYLTTPFAKQCDPCNVLESCLSGCLAQKVLSSGGLNKIPDPDCVIQDKGGR